jgi:CelD/BcsL family acetyltransferase involved in cellulose biosynthesis
LHDWIIAHDHEFDRYSPGLLLGRQMVEWAADNGFAEVDFGPGESQYKRVLTLTQRELGRGFVATASFSGLLRKAEYAACTWARRIPSATWAELPSKAMRRMDVLRGLGMRSTLADPWAALKPGAGAFRLGANDCSRLRSAAADSSGFV